MNNACLAALGAAVLATAGFAHAGVGPVVPMAIPAAVPASAAVRTVTVLGAPARVAARGADIVAVSDMAAPPSRTAWHGAPEKQIPVYSAMLSAVQEEPNRKTTEAPLPGALWLFGSALLAFLGICARRRF